MYRYGLVFQYNSSHKKHAWNLIYLFDQGRLTSKVNFEFVNSFIKAPIQSTFRCLLQTELEF